MNSEEFSDYPLWEIITHAISLARDIEVIYEPGVPELCQRITFIGQYVSSFSKSDPLLLNEQLLGPVLSDWRAVDQILTAIFETKVASELPKAVLNAENSLMRVGSWPANKDKKALTAQLSAMARDLIQSTHDERLKVSKTFGEALEEAQSEIESLKAELAELSLQNQETSTKLREEFTKSFEIASGEIEKNSKPVQDEIKGIRDNAKELFSELTSLRLEIVDLADAVTADYVSHHFKESSRRQFTLAIAAFSTALVLVIGSVCLYAFFLTNITELGITWKVISIKSSLTATILGAATIAIRIGFLSLRMANKFNRAELELKSINPLLQGVTEKDQAKVGFIERAFGYVWTEPSEQKNKTNFRK